MANFQFLQSVLHAGLPWFLFPVFYKPSTINHGKLRDKRGTQLLNPLAPSRKVPPDTVLPLSSDTNEFSSGNTASVAVVSLLDLRCNDQARPATYPGLQKAIH